MDYEDDNIKDSIEEKSESESHDQYRDRAAERRKQDNQTQNIPEYVLIDGFDHSIKLRGLDESLLQVQPELNTLNKNKKDVISEIKQNLLKLKVNKPQPLKAPTNPMAIKIKAYLDAPQIKYKNNYQLETIYMYDTDVLFGQSMPTCITRRKTKEQEQADQQSLILQCSEDTINSLADSLVATQFGSVPRYKNRHQFDQVQIIAPIDEEDIFAGVQPLAKSNYTTDNHKNTTVAFDTQQYITNVLDKNYYTNLEQQMKLEQEEKQRKLEKHRKMMGEVEDHYVECYQPSLLTFEDEKERKAEIERIKLINPDYEEVEFGKEEKKKKRKRTNFQKQLDDIEDIIVKKQQPGK